MNILYVNIRGGLGETGRKIQKRGHHLVLHSACAEALAALRHFPFDAVVIEDDNNDPEILHFTVEAHQRHPLPIFVASTWGHGLLRAIEQFDGLGEDEGKDVEFSAMGQADSMHSREFSRYV